MTYQCIVYPSISVHIARAQGTPSYCRPAISVHRARVHGQSSYYRPATLYCRPVFMYIAHVSLTHHQIVDFSKFAGVRKSRPKERKKGP